MSEAAKCHVPQDYSNIVR